MEQRLETIRDTKYEMQQKMIDSNVQYETLGEWVNMTRKQKGIRGYLTD